MKTMYVYILLCSDNSYYTGITGDLEKRLQQHNQGTFPSCYTYKRGPLKLVFYQVFNGSLPALAFEKKLKGWSRAKKNTLINNNWEALPDLPKYNKSNYKNAYAYASTPFSMTPTRNLFSEVEAS
jgi:putative endonuclease